MSRIDERIDRKREKITGTILRGPYEKEFKPFHTIDGKRVGNPKWCADVVIHHDQEVLKRVAISDFNFNIRHALPGTPVELQMQKSGMCQIVGRAEVQRDKVRSRRKRGSNFVLKMEGLKHKSGDIYETPNGNEKTVEDTTDTFIEVCRRGLPTVVSSSPQAGTTAPIKEAGIIAQINAEVLAGITLSQLVNRGTPVLYGSVPVRARMDTLGDSYGSIETSQYNIDCVQIARFYKIPNYSTSGVCDTKTPGQQASIERLFSDIVVALSGPQYLHCAYGLLDCNSVFCLLQAVLDDAHFQMLKFFLRPPWISEKEIADTIKQMKEVVATPQKLYIHYIRPVLRSGEISAPYPFEGDGEGENVFALAYERMNELLAKPVEHIDPATTSKIFQEIPGILPRLNVYEKGGSNE